MLTPTVPVQQLLRGIATNLSVTLPGADGEPAAGLTVTVTVTRADGTALYTDQSATGAGAGVYTYALTASDLSTLDVLTATWKVSSVTRAVSAHEVVSAFYFSQNEVAGKEQGRAPSLSTVVFAAIRAETEDECERLTDLAFVPRYRRAWVNGSGRCTLDLPDNPIRSVRSVRVYSTATSYTALSADELASIVPLSFGRIERRDGGWFTAGRQNILVEYEYGFDVLPADIKRAAIRRFRTRANAAKSGIPDRALSYTAENGATYRLATPGVNHTGDPEVDAVYQSYRERYSRPLVA